MSLTTKSHSQLKTVRTQEAASPASTDNYTSDIVFAGLDAVSGFLGPSPPPYSVSNNPVSSNASPFPNLSWADVFLWNPDNVEPILPTIPYLGELGFETLNHIGSFNGGTISTSIPEDDFFQEPRFGEFPGGSTTATSIPLPSYSTTVTRQQGDPNTYNRIAQPTYTQSNAPCNGSYNGSELALTTLGQTPANAAVTTSGPPFGQAFSSALS